MPSLRRLFARLRGLFGNVRREEELEREIATHLALLEEELQNKGLPPGEARLAARRAYGGVEQAKQLHREERAYQGIVQAAQDIRYSFRQLSRARGFTVAAVLTLALGIGANTAIFSVINAVLLKPFGYPDPDRIVQFMLTMPQGPARGASVPDFHLWRQQTRVFQDVSAYDVGGHGLNLTGSMPERIHGLHVTADYFRLFGARMLLGRTFTTQEDSPNGGNVVVVSYNLWKRKFGGDPHIVGKAISLENEPFTVLGVTGPRFQTEPAEDVWVPFQFDLNSNDQAHFYFVAGRLRPGVALDQANAELKLAANEARRKYPLADPELGYKVEPLRDAVVGDARSSLLMIGIAVSFVLLIPGRPAFCCSIGYCATGVPHRWVARRRVVVCIHCCRRPGADRIHAGRRRGSGKTLAIPADDGGFANALRRGDVLFRRTHCVGLVQDGNAAPKCLRFAAA